MTGYFAQIQITLFSYRLISFLIPLPLPLPPFLATLKQAREILRLAKAVKTEAEEMKGEVQRELELARRERHDAELLKKNAGEILKMAKERLHSASAK